MPPQKQKQQLTRIKLILRIWADFHGDKADWGLTTKVRS